MATRQIIKSPIYKSFWRDNYNPGSDTLINRTLHIRKPYMPTIRAVRRSENLGVPVLFRGHNLPPPRLRYTLARTLLIRGLKSRVLKLKIRYCEKATKFEKTSHLIWQNSGFYSLVSKQVEIFSNFCCLFRKAELYHFWPKNDGEKWSRFFYFEIHGAPSEISANVPGQFSLPGQIFLHWAAATHKGLGELQNKKKSRPLFTIIFISKC